MCKLSTNSKIAIYKKVKTGSILYFLKLQEYNNPNNIKYEIISSESYVQRSGQFSNSVGNSFFIKFDKKFNYLFLEDKFWKIVNCQNFEELYSFDY